MNKYQDRIKYIVVGVMIIISFLVAYSSFHNGYYPETTKAEKDRLSGEVYGFIENERNPYAPYFVGFDDIVNRGVSRDELKYIYDVITNFTLYNKNIYRSKVSYVKDSFERPYSKSLSTTYSFQFGINDSNIHKINVSANNFSKKISIKISDSSNKALFNRDFDMLLNANNS